MFDVSLACRFSWPLFHCALLCAACSLSSAAHAHSGGLNADGCHNNRKTGDYHCHRAPAALKDASASSAARRNLAPGPAPADSRGSAGGGAYRNCAQARAAGAAPVRIGEPGYGAHLDRDGDGIGCEPYRPRR